MSVFCPGEGENSRLVRRTVIRQTVLTIIELLRHISVKVKKRFPTYSHLVEAGVMTVSELRALERAQTMTDYPCYWIPITWASNIIQQAASQGYIKVARLTLSITIKPHINPCLGARILPNVDQRVGKCEGKVSRSLQLLLHLFPTGLHTGQVRSSDSCHHHQLYRLLLSQSTPTS